MIVRLRIALAAALAAVALPTGAAGDTPLCTHGVSSAGPVTLIHGHLSGNPTPDTEACLR